MVVLGDFNLSRVKWDFQDVLHWLPMEPESDSTKTTASKLRNLLALLDMKQFYPLHPNKDCSLELLFSNLAVEGSEALDPMVRCDEHHIPAVFTFEACVKDTIKVDRIVYNFKRSNVQGIVDTLNAVDWSESLNAETVDEFVSRFYNVLNDAVKENVPLMRLKNSTFPPWYTNELKSHIFKKKEAHVFWDEFKLLRAMCIRLSRVSRREYLEKTENSIQRNSKSFWSYVNGLKKYQIHYG